MKTLLQVEMYYVREYTPTCRFLKIINETRRVYKLECILHYLLCVSGLNLNKKFSRSSGSCTDSNRLIFVTLM
jgi:hypothetical protein